MTPDETTAKNYLTRTLGREPTEAEIKKQLQKISMGRRVFGRGRS